MVSEGCGICGKPEAIRRPYVLFTKRPEGAYTNGDTTSGWIVPLYGAICRDCFEDNVELLNRAVVRNQDHPYWEGK